MTEWRDIRGKGTTVLDLDSINPVGKRTIRTIDRKPPPEGKRWAQGYPESQILTAPDLPVYRVVYAVLSVLHYLLGREMLWAAERTPTGGCIVTKMVIPKGTSREMRRSHIGIFTQDLNLVRGGEKPWW